MEYPQSFRDKNFAPKLIASFILFCISGVGSMFLYVLFYDYTTWIVPGVLYSLATLVVFRFFGIRSSRKNLLRYVALTSLAYLGAFLLTMIGVWFAYVVRIFAAGAGAVVSFLVADKYILKLTFRKLYVFYVGGAAFLVTDILMIASKDKSPAQLFFVDENIVHTSFTEVIVFWPLFVGIYLLFTLHQSVHNGIVQPKSNFPQEKPQCL